MAGGLIVVVAWAASVPSSCAARICSPTRPRAGDGISCSRHGTGWLLSPSKKRAGSNPLLSAGAASDGKVKTGQVCGGVTQTAFFALAQQVGQRVDVAARVDAHGVDLHAVFADRREGPVKADGEKR